MTVNTAKSAGFCPGVKRAAELLEKNLNDGKKIYCLGELIHNVTYNNGLKSRGVKFITEDEISLVPENENNVIFIRAHGDKKEIYERLISENRNFVDATCPYVAKIHSIVSKESENKKPCIILGAENHPEVVGIKSFSKGDVFVFETPDEALDFIKNNFSDTEKPFFTVAQTTYNTENWKFFENILQKDYTNAKIFDTICSVTEIRQKETACLAENSDAMIVVGSKISSNTKKLYSIASALCKNTVWVENAGEIPENFGKNNKIISITAGASTPDVIIQEVKSTMTDTAKEELSFEELLNASFKTLTTGERVTGTILAVTPAEIKVDLGTKHTGILPYDEISASDEVNMADFRVGDPIEVVCTKFSDSEGTVMLSKKRLDEAKNLSEVANAAETGEILHGTVKEIVKGGVIVVINGVRVFVPAGQCGKDGELDSLKGQKVPVKVIEYNAQRKRVVGSIRNAKRVERQAALDEFYNSIEVGQKFEGTVRSVTSYGAFVNIGAADGMIHITEMFWGRPKNPQDVFKAGDKVPVYIKEIDREKNRISLGYKTEENNPWTIFLGKYKEGDVVNVTIANLMPFGAFAEIIPGVDGLIHCSQIAEKFVPNPASVLKIGDKVDAKITAIDTEKNRISLSIKALLVPEEAVSEEAPAEEPKEEKAE